MNRHERRSTGKQGNPPPLGDLPPPVRPVAPIVADTGKPGLLLRMISTVLLSRFMINRVSHPQVLFMLGEVARQARRMDALTYIQAKLPGPQ